MNKKILCLLLIGMFLVNCLPLQGVTAINAPQYTMENKTVQAGDVFTMDVAVTDNPGIISLRFKVVYDTEFLELQSVENSGILNGFTTPAPTITSPYTLRWADSLATTDNAAQGTVVTLTFKALQETDTTLVVIEHGEARNAMGTKVSFSNTTANVTVTCPHSNTVSTDRVDATCAQSGFTAGVYCNDCRTYISGHEEIPATGEHSDADGKWNYDEDGHYCECSCGLVYAAGSHNGGSATCTTKAVCDTCHVEYGIVDTSSHGQTEVRNASEASCNQEGYTGDTYCVDCGEMISTGSAIPATGKHIGGEATCMEQAVCEVCGTAYGELDADNHKYPSHFWPVEEATCTEPGYSGDAYCECGEIMWYGEVTPPNGHQDYDGDGICGECGERIICDQHTGGTATCTQQAVCEVCGTAYGELDADNHGETEIKGALEATCGNAGFTGDVYCVDCDELIEAGSMIAATGAHTDADEDAICDDCGAELPKTEEPNEDEENPKTSDFSMVWITMLMICSVLAVVCVGKKNSMA